MDKSGDIGGDGGAGLPRDLFEDWQPIASLAEQISEKLYRAIVEGQLAAGIKLSEVALAEQFGVSRTPVREALRRLAGQGIVRLNRGSVATVPELKPQEVKDLYEVRVGLIGVASYFAAQRATPRDIELLEDKLAELRKLAAAGDVDELLWHQSEFYDLLVKTTGNEQLHRLLQTHGRLALRARLISLHMPGRVEEALASHRALIDAIKERRPTDAETVVKGMLLAALEGIEEELELKHHAQGPGHRREAASKG